jgi:DNA adenine methylase
MINLRLNSPIRWPGGKFRGRDLIIPHLHPHSVYIELFAGGASIFFGKSLVPRSILNDLDSELINCYQVIRDQPEALIAKLEQEKPSKARFEYLKNAFKPANNIERAFRYFYLNRTAYSGIMNQSNLYYAFAEGLSMHPENWARRIRSASYKLKAVNLMNVDFETMLDAAPDGALVYADPPYFNAKQKGFYECSFGEEDHGRLARALKRHSNRLLFLVSYDDAPEIRSLYSWAAEFNNEHWAYTISRTDNRSEFETRPDTSELLIANYRSSAYAYVQTNIFQLLEN